MIIRLNMYPLRSMAIFTILYYGNERKAVRSSIEFCMNILRVVMILFQKKLYIKYEIYKQKQKATVVLLYL